MQRLFHHVKCKSYSAFFFYYLSLTHNLRGAHKFLFHQIMAQRNTSDCHIGVFWPFYLHSNDSDAVGITANGVTLRRVFKTGDNELLVTPSNPLNR